MDRNVEKQGHSTVSMNAYELDGLNVEDLDVQELERRLELAAAGDLTEAWKITIEPF